MQEPSAFSSVKETMAPQPMIHLWRRWAWWASWMMAKLLLSPYFMPFSMETSLDRSVAL